MTGPVSVGPARATVARSEPEVVRLVESARAAGTGIRATGSGGSKSDVTSAPGAALRLDLPDRLLAVDGGTVTVPAGMTTSRLQELLREEGLILPTVGEWRNATVAGALATGTHGGSARHGIMADSLLALRIVTGTGSVREVGRDDPDFRHLGVSLGAFGVVTDVTLSCDERFALEMVTDVVDFDEYVRDPGGQEARSEFHASVWVPAARRVIRFAADRVPDPERPTARRARFGRWTALATFLARRLGFHRAVSPRFLGGRAVADGADILSPLDVPSRLARFRNAWNGVRGRRAAELAVPAERAREVLERLDPFFREHGGPLNNPIGLRMSAADDFTISPCRGRDTLWLDIFYDEDQPFTSRLASLVHDVDARCHWGKTLLLPTPLLRSRYEGWEEFRSARARFDPDEVFANDFTDALGLTGEGPR